MASLVSYEQRVADIHTSNGIRRIDFVKCCPPSRLVPKGTIFLLHDYFHTSYQFRFVIDLFAMGGYNTIAPDLLNLSGGMSSGSTPLKTAVSCLHSFLSRTCPGTSVHLIGCGFGADLSSELAAVCPQKVASLVRSCGGSVENQMQQVMRLDKYSSKGDFIQAFETDFRLNDQESNLNSKFDIEEYVDAYTPFEVLSDMQHLFRTRTKLAVAETSRLASMVSSNPEQQPEEWAITVLSLLNQRLAKPGVQQARL